MDCMDGMKEFPDKYFDLAIVDPPYGDGVGGGFASGERFGGRFDRYRTPGPKSGTLSKARGGVPGRDTLRTDSEKDKPRRVGGGWAKAFGKKL